MAKHVGKPETVYRCHICGATFQTALGKMLHKCDRRRKTS